MTPMSRQRGAESRCLAAQGREQGDPPFLGDEGRRGPSAAKSGQMLREIERTRRFPHQIRTQEVPRATVGRQRRSPRLPHACHGGTLPTPPQGYDQHLNMVLGEVEETVTAVEIDGETFEEITKTEKR